MSSKYLRPYEHSSNPRTVAQKNFDALESRLYYVHPNPGAAVGPPTIGTWAVDEIYIDAHRQEWRCTVAGTPGTWERLGGVDTAADYVWTGYHTFHKSPRMPSEAVAYAASLAIDFNGKPFQTVTLTGDLAISTTNRGNGRMISVRLIGDASARSLNFATGIRFVGPKPTSLDAGKVAILSLTSFGDDETDTVAAYSAES
jgi:hypothetical protein